jgi:hypothetical protein
MFTIHHLKRLSTETISLQGDFVNFRVGPWGSRKNKFAILGVEAPAWQGAKTQEYLDIPSFRNAVRRDASASKM